MKAQLAIRENQLKLVDSDGLFIMKPSPEEYPHVAENEHATLLLMGKAGFNVPPCGLVRLNDGHLVFVIRRYDRNPDGQRIHQEDAMQAWPWQWNCSNAWSSVIWWAMMTIT